MHKEGQISKIIKDEITKIFLKKIFNFDIIEKSLNEKNLKMPTKAQFFNFRYRFAKKNKINLNLKRSNSIKK